MDQLLHANAYQNAQQAIATLKGAIAMLLAQSPQEGLSNAQIGRMLGIYAGRVGHVGHLPRTLLALMESEGLVVQDPASKRWNLAPLENPQVNDQESG
jgi:hypothetical protein